MTTRPRFQPFWLGGALLCLGILIGSSQAQTVVEASRDPARECAYFKVEGEAARLITRADEAHPAYDANDKKGPSLHYEVFVEGAKAPMNMPKGASGKKALFNTGTGEQNEEEARRNDVYLPHEEPPLGTVGEYRFRVREAGVYELFLRLAYHEMPNSGSKLPAHWAAPTNASGEGAIHVKDYDKGRPLNSSWWRRHNNSAWNLKRDAWTVVDFGPAFAVKEDDLNDQGYIDVIWQFSASHPGLIIDNLVLYRGYSIDPGESKYEQTKAYERLPLSVAVK